MILAPVGKPRATSSAATESIVSRRSTISVRSRDSASARVRPESRR